MNTHSSHHGRSHLLNKRASLQRRWERYGLSEDERGALICAAFVALVAAPILFIALARRLVEFVASP